MKLKYFRLKRWCSADLVDNVRYGAYGAVLPGERGLQDCVVLVGGAEAQSKRPLLPCQEVHSHPPPAVQSPMMVSLAALSV